MSKKPRRLAGNHMTSRKGLLDRQVPKALQKGPGDRQERLQDEQEAQ
jgi:hypothetical protein